MPPPFIITSKKTMSIGLKNLKNLFKKGIDSKNIQCYHLGEDSSSARNKNI